MKSSGEVIYFWSKDVKGIQDFPVFIYAGMNKKINEFTDASATANFSNAVSFDSDIAHKLDKNWTVGMTQRVDMGRKGKAQLPIYDVGFRFEYKL